MIEATMILMDNSEHARNGDLFPNRWEGQMEAVQLIANSKLETNFESGVGLILSAGKQVQLLMTPTNDQNQIVASCENVRLRGQIRFSVALYIAQLSLKHRINKKQNQRIMAFVASPVEEDEAALINLAKKLKKNNIAVDVINFGEQKEEHLQKMQTFVDTVKKGNNCMFVNIKPGTSGVFDQLITAITTQNSEFQHANEGAAQQQVQPGQPAQNQHIGAGQFAEYGGIDPNMDPELALALKLSLEEEKARQHTDPPQQLQPPQQQQQQVSQQQPPSQTTMQVEKPLQPTPKPNSDQIEEEEEDGEDAELLRKAKELSLMEEEEAKEANKGQKQTQQEKKEQDIHEEIFQDKDFMEELLKSAEVDMDNEDIKKLLNKGDDKSDDSKKKK